MNLSGQPGRVLLPPVGGLPQGRRRLAAQAGLGTEIIFWLVMPFFCQVFQYVLDTPALYLLSKIWPIITLPLVLVALRRGAMPYRWLYALLMFDAMLLAPLRSIMVLNNGLADAVATTVKMWSFLFYFSFTGMLVLLRPRLAQLSRAMLGWGFATFGLLWFLWLVLPSTAYVTDSGATRLFYWDEDRGNHIFMPMFFGYFLLFYLNRSFWQRPGLRQIWRLLLVAGGFASLIIIDKERLAIGTGVLLIGYGAYRSFPRQHGWMTGAGLIAAGLLSVLALRGGGGGDVGHSLGGSLSVRIDSAKIAFDFLRDHPLRWLLGAGAITKHGDSSMGDFFRDKMFYLSDIGWLGVWFEYGLLGSALLLAVYLAGLHSSFLASRLANPWTGALHDYAMYLLVSSVVYSVVYAPGEIACVTAMSLYALQDARTRAMSGAAPPRTPPSNAPQRVLGIG